MTGGVRNERALGSGVGATIGMALGKGIETAVGSSVGTESETALGSGVGAAVGTTAGTGSEMASGSGVGTGVDTGGGAQAATGRPWLAVVGLGEDGAAGLGAAARALVAGAEVVFGGRRHLALAGALVRGAARPWPSPFDPSGVLARRGRPTCVLASGDPFLHGVGATLARHVPPGEMTVVPAPSAFSLAAARLGWALQAAETVSLHGRPPELIRPLLHPGARVLALTSDGAGPGRLAGLLEGWGFGASRMHVLEALGGPGERLRSGPAAAFAGTQSGPLNLVALEVAAGTGARPLPLGGLEDGLFETDGQITKREIRAVTLSSLAPLRGGLLWDIGAGSGSIGIEWMLRHPSLRAVAVEARADRAARIRRNALALGVPGLAVVEGTAPGALAGLPVPDAIFLGGGGTDPGVLEAALAALPPGGRLVANAVTLEMQGLLAATAARLGGDLATLSVARAGPVGGMTAWRPALPVTHWVWVKP